MHQPQKILELGKNNGADAERRNHDLIVAKRAGQASGAEYQWLDTGAMLSQGDAYLLEIVHTDGLTEHIVIDAMGNHQTFLPVVVR